MTVVEMAGIDSFERGSKLELLFSHLSRASNDASFVGADCFQVL